MYADIQRERVSAAALKRITRLRLAPSVDPRELAEHIVVAVETGRRHVVRPRSIAPLLALGWLPRRATQLLLTGLHDR